MLIFYSLCLKSASLHHFSPMRHHHDFSKEMMKIFCPKTFRSLQNILIAADRLLKFLVDRHSTLGPKPKRKTCEVYTSNFPSYHPVKLIEIFINHPFLDDYRILQVSY